MRGTKPEASGTWPGGRHPEPWISAEVIRAVMISGEKRGVVGKWSVIAYLLGAAGPRPRRLLQLLENNSEFKARVENLRYQVLSLLEKF